MRPNICVECKYFVLRDLRWSFSGDGRRYRCKAVEQPIDMITGDQEPLPMCEDMRAIGGLCGPRGGLWEPLPPRNIQTALGDK